jgi:hypothetical protein
MPDPRFGAETRRAGTLSLAVALFACAGTQRAPQHRVDDAFARIQVHEASIERARLEVNREGASCEQVCAALVSARRAQAELCGIAREIADPDALARCGHAERATDSLDEQSTRRCACKAAS